MDASDEWVTGNVVLRIGGIPLEMQMTVPAAPVKPQRMLPIFQQMTNEFVGISIEAANQEGRSISCKASCGACCRQPVPVAEIEMYRIAELVDSMPEPRQGKIRKRFAAAVEHFENLGWFARMRECGELAKTEPQDVVMKQVQAAVMDYFHEGVPCPFLEGESCSIHESRPVACREYLVTSPADNCAEPTAANIEKLDLAVKPSVTLRHIGTSGNFAETGLLTLIKSLELTARFPEKFEEKTGEAWMADFFGRLTASNDTQPGSESA